MHFNTAIFHHICYNNKVCCHKVQIEIAVQVTRVEARSEKNGNTVMADNSLPL